MPRGAKPGQRRGGRPKGGVNKATLEKAVIAERIQREAEMSGRKLGKEVIEEFMVMFGGLAAAYQPRPAVPGAPLSAADMQKWSGSKDEVTFEKYSKLALKAATELADFQSPRLASVQTAAPAPDRPGKVKMKFTIGIFDDQGRKAPRHITVKPNSSVTSSAKN